MISRHLTGISGSTHATSPGLARIEHVGSFRLHRLFPFLEPSEQKTLSLIMNFDSFMSLFLAPISHSTRHLPGRKVGPEIESQVRHLEECGLWIRGVPQRVLFWFLVPKSSGGHRRWEMPAL